MCAQLRDQKCAAFTKGWLAHTEQDLSASHLLHVLRAYLQDMVCTTYLPVLDLRGCCICQHCMRDGIKQYFVLLAFTAPSIHGDCDGPIQCRTAHVLYTKRLI